ncbi:MAG: hypothetical protein PHV17_03970 [Candidatus Omnitrophica bacterium]|nr:hypothetical protein [Candidatus Omnitrophota bacterium]
MNKKINFYNMGKKTFKPMEIFRVKLNPDQAVLSCCALPQRGETLATWQCDLAGNPTTCSQGSAGIDAISS